MTAALLPMAVRTHCPFCAFQCGVLMGDGGSVSGDPNFPVNNGQLCIKGWSATTLLSHPQRLLTPLVRDRRTEPFRKATWNDALDRVAGAMLRVRSEHGPDANGVFGSGALTNEKAYLLGKFARVALGTVNIDYNGRYCMASAAAASNRALGIDRGLPCPVADVQHSKLIVLVGANSADTLPPIMQWLERQRANGGRLVVLDPRRTATSRAADLHLQLTPGTDLLLANGLLHLLIEAGAVDREYIAARTIGWESARAVALQAHPAHVERLTGVREAQLRQLASWLCAAESCMILSGRGAEQHSKGVDTVHAWINLALALGLPGKPFSGWGTLTGQGNGQGGREHGQKADQLPGYRLIENEAARDHLAGVWGVTAASLPHKGRSAFELLDSLGPGGVRTLLVMGSNVAVASPDAGRVAMRLTATDFLVVVDAFANDTTAHADVVLPGLQWAEEDGTLTNFEGRVLRRRQTARPPIGPRSDIDILCELADRLGHANKFAYRSAGEVFAELRRASAGGIADYGGISYEKIEASDGVFWPCPTDDHPGTPRLFTERFHHPDGKARFFPVTHRPSGDPLDSQYPYLFTTGRYKEHYNSGSQTRQMSRLIAAKPCPRLQVHPAVARRHTITPGDWVTLESRRGRAEFTADVTSDVRPDTLFAPFHWGGRSCANALIGAALDPVSRMPEFKLAAVRVAAVVKPGVAL